jgi:hypothetical protein
MHRRKNVSPDIKTRYPSPGLRRITETDDLDAQVQALKELQKQTAFIARKSTSKKGKGLFPMLRDKWKQLVCRFSRK